MKIFTIFPVIFTALFSRGTSKSATNPFDDIYISPLYLNDTTTIIIETRAVMADFKFYISNETYTNQVFLTASIRSPGKYVYKYYNGYTRKNNEVYVAYKSGTAFYTNSVRKTMNVSSANTGLITNNVCINTKNTISKLSKSSGWSDVPLSYTFDGFDGVYMPDYYHKIRLNDFNIKFDTYYREFFSTNVSLIIQNVDGVFDDISKTNEVEFPLSIKDTANGCSFNLKDILYVNKETLMLSKTAKDGYVSTKHIYLPRNEMRNQDKYTAYLVFTKFGLDKSLLRYSFSLHALKNIVGDCRNSEYCIQRTDS